MIFFIVFKFGSPIPDTSMCVLSMLFLKPLNIYAPVDGKRKYWLDYTQPKYIYLVCCQMHCGISSTESG